MQKRVFLMVLIFCLFEIFSEGLCQKVYNVRALDFGESIILDGILNERAWRTLITPLERLEKYEVTDTSWISIQDDAFPGGITVNWRAVWSGNTIYLGIEVDDDIFNRDNYRQDDPRYANIQNDDGAHVFWDNQKNVPWLDWDWIWPNPSETQADSNYLIHNIVEDSFFVQLGISEVFRVPTWAWHPGSLFNFKFHYSSDSSLWSIEAAVKSDSVSFSAGDFVWAQVSYNDADTQFDQNRIVRERRLVWNDPGEGFEPWDKPGKLLLTGNSNVVEYQVLDIPSHFKITIDGQDNEEFYLMTTGATISNARTVTPQPNIIWSPWSNYDDAFVIMHAVSDFSQNILYLLFKVFDNYKNSIPFIGSDNLLNDDALLLWVDYDDDRNFLVTGQDINLLIRNTGTMYKFSGFGEQYDSISYSDDRIKLKTQPFGPFNRNWIAEIALKLPSGIQKGDILRIDFGYNDADSENEREHQLVWSTSDTNVTPWNDFTKLGRFILTGDPISSVHQAEAKYNTPMGFQLYPNYPNPFNNSTNIRFSLEKNSHITIAIYDLLGRRVTTLVDSYYKSGIYQLKWDGRNNDQHVVTSGIYFVKMTAGDFSNSLKMAFIR